MSQNDSFTPVRTTDMDELKEILDEIVFQEVPDKADWGKPTGPDRQFINGQVAEYGKTPYVKFGEDSANGILKITCVGARLDRNVQTFGKMDPYVTIINGKEKVQTNTHDDGGSNPVWNQTFELEIRDQTRLIEFAVRDEETFADRDVGTVKIRADKLIESGFLDKQWQIKHDEENAGSLHLKSEWLPDETPEAVKNAKGKKKQVSKKPEGFEGEMIGDKRTGKCQQFFGDSLFDGYMLNDELVQGRFYFSNGDFFMGTFKDNEMDKGTYIRFEDKLKVTGASFQDGELTGTPESLEWTYNEMKCSYKGPLTESKPNGKGTLMYGDHIASGTWVMGELEKNEYVDDRNEEGLNGEESKEPKEKVGMNLGLHVDMQNALKEKFKAEFVQIQEELAKQKQITIEALEKRDQLEAEQESKVAEVKEAAEKDK